MVNKIDRLNRTPISRMVLSLTFKVWSLRVYHLTTSPFCLKGWEGVFSYFSKHRLILYKVPLCHKDILIRLGTERRYSVRSGKILLYVFCFIAPTVFH